MNEGPIIHWVDRASWYPALTTWLEPWMKPGSLHRLQTDRRRNLCWDDPDWLDVLQRHIVCGMEAVQGELADWLSEQTLRCFHGCRIDDAGIFEREGLKLNEPGRLEAEARRIVAEEDELSWMRDKIEQLLSEVDFRERDTGRSYIVLDGRSLSGLCSHYCMYGSEWLQCFFGFSGHHILRRRGVPTILHIDFPLKLAKESDLQHLASAFLQEWIHVTVNRREWVPERDFSFILRIPLPGSMIVGHEHPERLLDVYRQKAVMRSFSKTCPSCVERALANASST